MNKTMAGICTGVLVVILLSVYFSILYITRNDPALINNSTLEELLTEHLIPTVVGCFMVGLASHFYEWLIQPKE